MENLECKTHLFHSHRVKSIGITNMALHASPFQNTCNTLRDVTIQVWTRMRYYSLHSLKYKEYMCRGRQH